MAPSKRRKEIRTALSGIITTALAVHFPDCEVFTARGESDNLQDFVCIYFDTGDREQKFALVDAEAELVIRISTKEDPRLADDRLDDISQHIETVVEQTPVHEDIRQIFHERFSYADSPSGNYSALELTYRLLYHDS